MHARYYKPLIGRFLSVDRHPGHSRAPQSWNRYGYTRGNPLKYFDPDGLDVVIARGDRAAFARAYAGSATLRAEFNAANSNRQILVRLSLTARNLLPYPSTNGDTHWAGKFSQNYLTKKWSGAINSLVVIDNDPRREASYFAHELHHDNELAANGYFRKTPGFRENSSDRENGETAGAQQAEKDAFSDTAAGPAVSLSDGDLTNMFSHSSDWDDLTDEQRQQCLSDVACLALGGYGAPAGPPPR